VNELDVRFDGASWERAKIIVNCHSKHSCERVVRDGGCLHCAWNLVTVQVNFGDLFIFIVEPQICALHLALGINLTKHGHGIVFRRLKMCNFFRHVLVARHGNRLLSFWVKQEKPGVLRAVALYNTVRLVLEGVQVGEVDVSMPKI